ncbi:MAG: UDP-N-acetylmuramate dehydrogenase [Hyphomicrobiales bacterium]
MSLEDIRLHLPEVRGRYRENVEMSGLTWFRVGGPADIVFSPADEDDLAHFLGQAPQEIPIYVVGVGSNLLVRDGGLTGVVIRLGRGFNAIEVEDGDRIRVGTAVPDVQVAKAALDAGIKGLTFLRGIPGTIGGALRMNGGAYERETKDVLIEARAVDRSGKLHVMSVDDMNYSYRHCGAPEDYIFTQALLQGEHGDKEEIARAMQAVTEARENAQPVRSRTGGSTFKNPPGGKAWQLIDAAGMRGHTIGGAQVSEKHCNFLINTGDATAEDIENLGELVRAKVKETSGVELSWEIKRVGRKA